MLAQHLKQKQVGPDFDGDDDAAAKEKRHDRIQNLSMTMAKLRAQYIEGRESSGIEEEWREDEEFYEGIDAYNRAEMSTRGDKPMGTAPVQGNTATGSTIFLNVVRPYCDAVSAKMGETLMPTDDRAWEANHTPIPDVLKISKGKLPIAVKNGIDKAFPDDPLRQNKEVDSLVADAKEEIQMAREIADRVTMVIDDWHVEGQYHTENRIVFDDAVKVGSGVLKGPFQVKRRVTAYVNGKLVIETRLAPASKRISYHNLYPDPGCGQNIHRGSGIFERDDVTAKELMQLKGVDDYDPDQIDEVLKEGPHRATKIQPDMRGGSTNGLKLRETKYLYEIWYYHGMIEREDLEVFGVKPPSEERYFDAKVTMVNNHVIRAVLNTLEDGEFPYDIMVFQRREGSPWGIGLARQMRTPQRMINAAARNMMNNAGLAGGPQLIVQHGVIEPEDGIWEFKPLKVWIASEDAQTKDLDNAFRFVEVPMLQDKLEAIINLGLRMAELVTGFPLIMQGAMGGAPDKVGIVNILDNNGSAVIRRLARLYDDLVTEPQVRRYHKYMLSYHEDDTLKTGDMSIDARGSSALVEKAQKNQALIEIAKLGLQNDPRNKIDPVKFGEQILRSLRLDPKVFAFDDEEWEEMVGNWDQILKAQEQAGDSKVMIAQLRAEVDQMRIASTERIAGAKIEMQGAVAVAGFDLERELEQTRGELELLLSGVNENMDAMKLEGDMKQNGDKIKADLAKKVMDIQATLDLVRAEASAARLPKPPVEPPGKAAAGESYTQ